MAETIQRTGGVAMKTVMLWLVAESACAISLAGSIYLAANDKWMWWLFLIFAACNMVTSYRLTK